VKRLQDLQIQVNVMEHQVEETMVICEERVNKERMLLLELEERHQAAMTRARDYMLRENDAVMFRDPPREVQIFLDHCKWLVEQMKILIARVRD